MEDYANEIIKNIEGIIPILIETKINIDKEIKFIEKVEKEARNISQFKEVKDQIETVKNVNERAR